MNAVTRWDPVKEMEELQNRLSNLFGRTPTRLGDAKEESITVAEEFRRHLIRQISDHIRRLIERSGCDVCCLAAHKEINQKILDETSSNRL